MSRLGVQIKDFGLTYNMRVEDKQLFTVSVFKRQGIFPG